MTTYIRFIHRISPRPTDVEGPFPDFPASLEAGRSFIHKHTGIKPRLKNARAREEGDGWVYFPQDKPGNWHSISIIHVDTPEELPECLKQA